MNRKGQIMYTLASTPNFDEIASIIKSHFDTLRAPYKEWTDLARCAIMGRYYDKRNFASIETYINTQRIELRRLVLIASEHFTTEQVRELQRYAKISKYAWRSLKKSCPVNLKNGFNLLCY